MEANKPTSHQRDFERYARECAVVKTELKTRVASTIEDELYMAPGSLELFSKLSGSVIK